MRCKLAVKKGFKNISIDLSDRGRRTGPVKRELEEIVKLPVTHISCYALTYEKGYPLFMSVQNESLLR